MARIVHIAIKVENLENATRFYEDVYGFKQVSTERNGQHVSPHDRRIHRSGTYDLRQRRGP